MSLGISRLENIFPIGRGQRFHLLYGPGLQDGFITSQYVEMDFEQVLTLELKRLGFERVVFFAPSTRRLYLRDQDSYRLSHRSDAVSPDLPANKSTGFFPWPEGRVPATQQMISKTPSDGGMSDERMVKLLNEVMSEPEIRSAVVIQDPQINIRFFDAKRRLYGDMADWNRLSSAHDNICIWLFDADTLEALTNAIRELNLPFLKAFVERAMYVGMPDQVELRRLVDYARLRYDLSIADWRILEPLTARMAQGKKPVLEWMASIKTHKNLDTFNLFV